LGIISLEEGGNSILCEIFVELSLAENEPDVRFIPVSCKIDCFFDVVLALLKIIVMLYQLF
jgi:hypothetical protein